MQQLSGSVWQAVPLGPKDPILGVSEAFKADTDPDKVSLGVGAYRDDHGKPYILQCVAQAEAKLPQIYKDKEYIPIDGLSEFNKAACTLAYGHLASTLPIAVCQSLSGTGALKVGAEFLAKYHPNKLVYVPNPTWGNHFAIFRTSGHQVSTYRYWDPVHLGLHYAGMLEDLAAAPENSIVVLHACAHNPTGVDPTREQWEDIKQVIIQRGHLVFFDMAYQGFASGNLDEDAYAVRSFVECGKVPILLAQSFAKNMGLYGERVGAFSVVCTSNDEKDRVLSQVKIIARGIYSSPPIHGARIVAIILQNESLTALWYEELAQMANRIKEMRSALRRELEALEPKKTWEHITSQIGMFCYTGMTEEQVSCLTKNHHIYLTKDGRISLAGLNSQNLRSVALAIHNATSN